MAVWLLLLIVFGAGLLGGTINALISDNGFVIPKKMDGILRPGWLGNALIGGIAAAISWSMYGPLAAVSIVTAATGGPGSKGDLTLAAFGGAILAGVAGARWLTNEVDKALLRAAGIEVAKKQSDAQVVAALEKGTPAAALQAAQSVLPQAEKVIRQ